MARKKAAVLKSSLLVRKGEAEPSVFSPSFQPIKDGAGRPASPAVPVDELAAKEFESAVVRKAESAATMDRIKNAMSRNVTIPFPASKTRAASQGNDRSANKQEGPKRPLAGEAAVMNTPPRSPGKPRRRAMTLRLDPERHRRLKILGIYTDRSAQNILTAALDEYLDRVLPSVDRECSCLNALTRVVGSA